MIKKDRVLIIGAGLCGSLLALRLAQRGYKVTVFESRPDLRKEDVSSGRSINLALSNRGFKALRLTGIDEKVKNICIPMYGRLMHDKEGKTFISNYSGREGEYINSISRGDLNGILLNEAEAHENVVVYFNSKCLSVDIDNTKALFKNYKTKEEFEIEADVIFGADGAGSVLRKNYYLDKKFLFSFSQDYLAHGYKELEIPANTEGKHQISKDHLHIWPRGGYMLIALPNLDGSFTVTLFLSYEKDEYNFKNLSSEDSIKKFFKEQFPDALELIPDVASEFANNPTGPLGTIKCSPWCYKGKTLIIGDAAHAIVPFYGQGMNASFEDVCVLDSVLNEYEGDWEVVFKVYQERRKIDTDAIGNLAIENYYEMRDHVANPLFKEKRALEMELERNFPKEYYSKYSMVTFNEGIGYNEARTKGNAQDKALLNLIANNQLRVKDNSCKEELLLLLKRVQVETQEVLKEDEVAGLS